MINQTSIFIFAILMINSFEAKHLRKSVNSSKVIEKDSTETVNQLKTLIKENYGIDLAQENITLDVKATTELKRKGRTMSMKNIYDLDFTNSTGSDCKVHVEISGRGKPLAQNCGEKCSADLKECLDLLVEVSSEVEESTHEETHEALDRLFKTEESSQEDMHEALNNLFHNEKSVESNKKIEEALIKGPVLGKDTKCSEEAINEYKKAILNLRRQKLISDISLYNENIAVCSV